jgi:hypothetical protein
LATTSHFVWANWRLARNSGHTNIETMIAIATHPTTKKTPKNSASPRLPSALDPVRRSPRFFS